MPRRRSWHYISKKNSMRLDICEALYALPGGVVVARRRSMMKPIVYLCLGIVLCIINFVAVEDKNGALGMLLMVCGISLVAYGIFAIIARFADSEGVPYDTEARRYMVRRERYFDHELLKPLSDAVARGDREAIDSMPTTNVARLTLVEYRTPGTNRTAWAIYEYVDFSNRLYGEVKILSGK